MMYALVTAEGTAMGETSLCEEDYKDASARREMEARARLAGDAAEDLSFRNCDGNEMLECQVCGVPAVL